MKQIKRWIACLLVLCMVISMFPIAVMATSEIASGECGDNGDNVTWTFYSDGLLKISGNGAMKNYSGEFYTPWYEYHQDGITSVIIENGVTSIGNYVFYGCYSLNSVTIPDSVTSIGTYAFDYCMNLGSISIPDSVTSIGDCAFAECNSLISVTIPDSITSIGNYIFHGCDSLSNVTIPNSITSIGDSAFRDCSSLVDITIPDSITFIGECAFRECNSLISIAIPEGVTTIENYLFYGCEALTRVTIPDAITSIGTEAFCDCSSLTEVYFTGNAPTFGDMVFDNVTATAYFPSGNTTWTSGVMQNYGGIITWVPYEGESGTVEVPFAGGDGTESNPYQVSNAEQLNAVRNAMDAYYIQTADIDLNGQEWTPIGYIPVSGDASYFSGAFDGNGFKISNLSITQTSDNRAIGLFGANKGTLSNITLETAVINVDVDYANDYDAWTLYGSYVGGVVGWSTGSITNCTVSGSINVANAHLSKIGGIAGMGGCDSCINHASVTAQGAVRTDKSGSVSCGGLIGHGSSINVSITNSVNYGDVNASADAFLYCGGVSGEYGQIDTCVNYGKVTGTLIENEGYSSTFAGNCNVGGIVGATSSDLNNNCVNFGNVTASKTCSKGSCLAGGIAGYIGSDNTGKISNCYNLCETILADSTVGRIAGRLIPNNTSECYSIDTTTVNGEIPTEVGTTTIHGGSMSEDEINIAIKDILAALDLDVAESAGTVRFFREWDAENQIAYFDNDALLGSQVTEETDTSFLTDVDNLVGHYVLAETKARDDSDVAPDTLISIKPVETKTGTVTAADEETITIDGVVYATPEDDILTSALVDNLVLYHLYEGELVGIELLVTEEGTLTYWNTETRELVITNNDQTATTFTVSELADEETLTFLGETGYTEQDVQYVADNNKFVYKVKMQPISVEPAKFEFGKDDFSFLNTSSDYFTTEERVWHETLSQVSILQGFDTNYNYHISDQAFSHLIDGMSNTVAMYLDAARSMKWEGSCFGMAAVAAIRYIDESRLPIEQIDTNLSSNSNTYDLSAPVESLSTEDLINYYMFTQYLPRSGVITEQNTDLVSTDYLGAVTKIINTLNSGTPVMVCISNSEISGGHTIVLLDVKGSTQDYYEISVYDPNYSEETLLYLYTSPGSNTNKIRIAYSSSANVNTEAITYNQIHQFFTSVSEIDMKNYFGVDNNSLFTDFDRAYFQINQNTDVIISTGNASLSYQDGEVVSAENVSGPYYYCADADSSSTVYFTFDFVDITSDEILCELQSADDDSCKAQIVLDDWSLSVSSDQNLKLSIDSQTCNATITSVDKGFISFLATQDKVDAEWPWYASAVDFENATNVVVSYTDNGIKLESDGLNNASIAAMNDTELIVNDISCDETVVQLIENDGTIEAVSPHIHSYEAPEFVWSDDDTCTATFTCIDGDDTQTVVCTVTSETTPATETEAGATVYTATVEFNGQTYTDTKTVEIPATGHVTHITTLVPAVEATCEHTGNIAYYTCSGCNLWFEDAEATKVIEDHNSVIIPLAVHSYESVVTAPTCTEQGYTTHTCSVCGDSYVDSYVDAAGHSFGEWTETKAATCTDKGEKSRTCACGETETCEIDALGHTAADAVKENEVAASCGTDGSYDSVVYCVTCGNELSRETITVPATGDHNYATEQERVEATCTEDGYVIMACGCGLTETTILPASGHSYESVVTDPTCTEQGFTTHTCSRCNDSYVDTYVDATGHTFENGVCAECGTTNPDDESNCNWEDVMKDIISKLISWIIGKFPKP